MLSRKADGPLVVQVPSPRDDRPVWWRVGLIAAAGLVVGFVWPRIAGLRPSPNAPEAAPASAGPASSASAPPAPPEGSAAELAAAAALPSAIAAPTSSSSTAPSSSAEVAPAEAQGPPPPAAATGAKINVLSGPILSCKTDGGEQLKGGDCGKLKGLDALVLSKLKKLADCPDAAAARGRMTLVMHLDFPHGWLSADLGHTQTVAAPDALLACARADLAGATLATVSHDNARYSALYTVVFEAADGVPAAPSTEPAAHATEAAEGTALVVWEVAIVRDVPKTGKVLARLQRGTEVRVGPVKDGWYPVKYGDGDANDGWVYRGAIGK